MTLVSFDIDGTLVFGDPPGAVTLEMVQRAKALGYIVGSCSDRTLRDQSALWERFAVQVDFVSLKHRLDEVKQRFAARRYLHIGDTEVDRYYATRAGFEFYPVHDLPEDGAQGWIF
jgi:hypothetical protein